MPAYIHIAFKLTCALKSEDRKWISTYFLIITTTIYRLDSESKMIYDNNNKTSINII